MPTGATTSSSLRAIGNLGDQVTRTMQSFGFRQVDPMTVLAQLTGTFGTIVQYLFQWIYFLSEIGILVGALAFVFGAIGHHARTKGMGVRIVGFSILGFVLAVVLPGVILAINGQFRG